MIEISDLPAALQQATFSVMEKITSDMSNWKISEVSVHFSPNMNGIKYLVTIYNENGDPDTLCTGEWTPKCHPPK